MSSGHKLSYRPDIDGLRALAVLAVILYHLKLSFMAGGFVGVDVFLVISGFLITKLCLDEDRLTPKTYALFILRRLKRLMPGMVTIVGLSCVAAYFILLPDVMAAFGKSAAAALLFVSNLIFAREAGYFDIGHDMKPLLHTWSLGVEMQFYLFFPLFFFIARRFMPVVPAVLVLAVLSFIGTLAVGHVNPDLNFYLMPTRLWEFAFGALAALPQGPKLPEKWQGVASTAGLLGMVASFVLFRAGISHPGPWALVPCIATWLVIASPAFNAKIFAQFERAGRVLSYTGRISYHLYLFHYPLIVFGLYVLQRDMNVPEKLIVMAVTFALAMISYSYIERPVRAAKSPVFLRRAGIVMALLVLVFGCFGAYAYQSKGIKGRFPSLPQGLLDGVYAHLDPRHASCMDKDPAEYPGNLCRIGTEKAEPDTLLWGDSHALMYMPVVEAAAKEEGHSVLVAGISNCPPVPGLIYFEHDNRRNHRDCPVHNKALMDYVLKTPSLHTVILGGFWLNRIYDDPGAVQPVIKPDYILERGAAPDPEGRAQQFFEALSTTILTLEKAGKHVVLIGPIPAYDFDVPQRLGQALLYGGNERIGTGKVLFRIKTAFVEGALNEIGKKEKISYIDPLSVLCHDEFCYAAENGRLLYADKSHMERSTTMRLKSQFLKALQ